MSDGSTLSPAHVTQLLPRPYGRVQTPYRGYSVAPSPLCFSHYVEIEVHRARHRQQTHHCQRCTAHLSASPDVLQFPHRRLQEAPPLQKCSNYIKDVSQLSITAYKTRFLSLYVFEWTMYSLYAVIIVRMFFIFVSSVGFFPHCWGKYLSCAALEVIYLYCISKTLRSWFRLPVLVHEVSHRGTHCWTIILHFNQERAQKMSLTSFDFFLILNS